MRFIPFESENFKLYFKINCFAQNFCVPDTLRINISKFHVFSYCHAVCEKQNIVSKTYAELQAPSVLSYLHTPQIL